MSAIAGFLRFDGPVTPAWMAHVVAGLQIQAPHGTHQWAHGPAALVHCLLDTRPAAPACAQPLRFDSDGPILVLDGRLDNREELLKTLRHLGRAPAGHSDAELVLAAYELWGRDSPSHLLGDFAFAVWDERSRTLFCAVDQMGGRPLYYVHTREYFAFASDEEALVGLPGIPGLPNAELVATIFAPSFQSYDRNTSWIRDVKALGAAHNLVVGLDRTPHVRSYWEIEPGEEITYGSDEEYQEAFLEIFSEAVRCRMVDCDTVAAMMSGGLDSACIAAAVQRIRPPAGRFETYSAVHDDIDSCPESRCIRSLTRDLGDSAHVLRVPSFTGFASLPQMIDIAWAQAHPCDNALLLPAAMCLAASKDGHRVVLHGANGDLVSDVPDRYIAYLLRDGQWGSAWGESIAAATNNNFLRGSAPAKLQLLNAWTAFAPPSLKAAVHRCRSAQPSLVPQLLNREFADRIDLRARLAEHERRAANSRQLAPDVRVAQAGILSGPRGPAMGIRGYGRLGARFGVETRDAWADKRVVEFFLRLPLRQKIRHGWTKYLARTALKGYAEDEVRWRIGKEHLGWHFIRRVMAESQDRVAETIEQGLGAAAEYLDARVAKDLYRRYAGRAASPPEGFDTDRQAAYEITTLALWMARLAAKTKLSNFVT